MYRVKRKRKRVPCGAPVLHSSVCIMSAIGGKGPQRGNSILKGEWYPLWLFVFVFVCSKDCKKNAPKMWSQTSNYTASYFKRKRQWLRKKRGEIKSKSLRHWSLMCLEASWAGDQDCKLPIVQAQVMAKKGNKIVSTYAFLDQGSTAVSAQKARFTSLA